MKVLPISNYFLKKSLVLYVVNATGNHRASKVFAIQRAAATGLSLSEIRQAA